MIELSKSTNREPGKERFIVAKFGVIIISLAFTAG
jgi:hypothetical protein